MSSPAEGRSSRRGPVRRPQKMSEYTARLVVADIVGLDLGPGDRLPAVPAMAERYDVGYASVREALRTLEAIGLISVKPGPGGGPIVNDRTGAEFSKVIRLYCQVMGVTFRQVIVARQALEPILARQVAATGSDELREALAEAALAHDDGDRDSFREQAREFHDILASHTDFNPVLSLFVRAVGQVYTEFIRGQSPNREPADRPSVLAEHRAIAQAIRSGDADAAERLMAQHMADLAEYISQEYGMVLDDVIEWL